MRATVLGITHLFRVAAVEHFADHFIVIRNIVAGVFLLEILPVVNKNLLEC